MLAAGGLGVFFGLVFAFLWLSSTDTAAEASLRRFAFTPESLHSGPHGRVAISPDGKHIVYVGGDEQKLWVRDGDREQPRELAGTKDARTRAILVA